MTTKRTLNVHEALKYLENLEILSSDEPDFWDEFVSEGRLVIVPPSNIKEREIAEDSGEENGIDSNHLKKTQKTKANAHVEWNTSHSAVSVGITDSSVNEPTKQNDKENRKKSQKPKLVCH